MANMHQVYLSKSNRANPDYVMMVRVYLEERGYEVIEHKGGTYEPNLLLKCNYMIMVGEHCPSAGSDGNVMVGKGQYGQLRERQTHGLSWNVYFSHTQIFGTGDKAHMEPVFRSVVTNGIVDENNWTIGYGKLKCKMESYRRMTPITSSSKKPRSKPVWVEDASKTTYTEGIGNPGKVYPIGTVSGKLCTRKKLHFACIILFK